MITDERRAALLLWANGAESATKVIHHGHGGREKAGDSTVSSLVEELDSSLTDAQSLLAEAQSVEALLEYLASDGATITIGPGDMTGAEYCVRVADKSGETRWTGDAELPTAALAEAAKWKVRETLDSTRRAREAIELLGMEV